MNRVKIGCHCCPSRQCCACLPNCHGHTLAVPFLSVSTHTKRGRLNSSRRSVLFVPAGGLFCCFNVHMFPAYMDYTHENITLLLTSVIAAIFKVNLGKPACTFHFLPLLVSEETLLGVEQVVFTRHMPLLPSNQQYQSTGGITALIQTVVWPHHVLFVTQVALLTSC